MVVHEPKEKIPYYKMMPNEWRQFKKNNQLYCQKYSGTIDNKEVMVGGPMKGDYVAKKGAAKGQTIPVDAFYVLAKNKGDKNVWVPFSPIFGSSNQSLHGKYYTIHYCIDSNNPKITNIPKKIPGKHLDFYTRHAYERKNRYIIFEQAIIDYDFKKALSNDFIKQRLLGSSQDTWHMNVGRTPHIIRGSNLKEEEIDRLKQQKTITDQNVGAISHNGLTIAIKLHPDRKYVRKKNLGEGYIRVKIQKLI